MKKGIVFTIVLMFGFALMVGASVEPAQAGQTFVTIGTGGVTG
ncbi:MAG: C4-dicarboxylate ABC transporter substrate-binding protein, partial [Desulfobacterales bacterium]|nr:C4-dicarboxylate ABC transporter substrate-binding protein [Desulfobacterales bacterium]